MVRHGTAKKRRRGLKVKRKSPKNNFVKVANAVTDEACKSSWDKSKTPAENLKSMGLDPNPNALIRTEPLDPNNVGFMGYMTIDQQEGPDPFAAADSNPKRKKMSEYDQSYILKLVETYGDDYKKMHRDIKLNCKQFSESQLIKAVEKYNSLPESQKIKLP